jgi:hypothetical protein
MSDHMTGITFHVDLTAFRKSVLLVNDHKDKGSKLQKSSDPS